MTLKITRLNFQSRWYPCLLTWQDVRAFWRYQHRRADLERLIQWTVRKRLTGPRAHYQMLLADTEQHLLKYQLRRPHLTWWLRLFFGLTTLLFPPQQRYRKGSAAKYKLRNYSLNWRTPEKRVLSY